MKKFSRREFLKISGIGTAAFSVPAAFAGIIPIDVRGRNVAIFNSKFRKGIHTICDLCPARCGVIGFLRYEDIVAIQGNPNHLNNQGKICARGIAGVNQVYDTDRILHPLKRIGKRGEHKWQQISWEQALAEMSRRLQQIKNSKNENQFVFQADPHRLRGLTKRFLQAFGKPTLLTGGSYQDFNRQSANQRMWGVDRGIADAANSQYFLIFGGNPFETHPDFVQFNQRLIQARLNKRAKLVTVDPRLSNTAGRSDEWLPIKPGTDAIVALAMANVIVQNQLFDDQFINRWTDVTVNQLRSYLAQFTIEKAAEQSLLDASKIERIALEFARKQPGVALTG
ncbi:MAG: molybdopterin-dependent oxidoreductase, partial [bacterium]|nr:molybdopterin-dependent oxidoreductase [bacterium]